MILNLFHHRLDDAQNLHLHLYDFIELLSPVHDASGVLIRHFVPIKFLLSLYPVHA